MRQRARLTSAVWNASHCCYLPGNRNGNCFGTKQEIYFFFLIHNKTTSILHTRLFPPGILCAPLPWQQRNDGPFYWARLFPSALGVVPAVPDTARFTRDCLPWLGASPRGMGFPVPDASLGRLPWKGARAGPGSSDAAGPALSRQPKTSSGDPTAPSRGESTPYRGGHSAPGLQYLPSPTLRSAAPGLTGRTRRRGRDGAAAGGIPERRKGGSGAGSPRPWRG